jgi:hypothetical protein
MSFSRAQHIAHFRPMVGRAWAPTRARLMMQALPAGEIARRRRAWYERELQAKFGVTSTNDLNPKKDFEEAMAHFEAIAGDSIEWQLKLFSGDARRVLHEIRDLCRNFDLDESYARGIARQALQLDALPDIGALDAKSLVTVLRALKIHAARDTEGKAVPF